MARGVPRFGELELRDANETVRAMDLPQLVGRWLIAAGALLALLGALLVFGPRALFFNQLGHLPGDLALGR